MTHVTSSLPNQYPQPSKHQGKDHAIRVYRAAQSHYKNGAWKSALSAVEALLVNYPKVSDLHAMRADLLERIHQEEMHSFKRNPIYRAAMRHLKNGELIPGQVLINRLVNSYPQDAELKSLQKELYERVKQAKDRSTHRRLLISLVLLLLMFGSVSALFLRYLQKPAPLAELIIPNTLNYKPHYLFSIYGTDKPMGVSLSPQEDRVYVTEMGGSRLVRVFDTKGNPTGTIELPHTNVGERAPVYLATDGAGRIYISDRKQHAVYIFNPDGEYLDALVGPGFTLSEYVTNHTQGQLNGEKFAFNIFQNTLFYQDPEGVEQSVPLPMIPEWSPLGIRIDKRGTLFLTDVEKDHNSVLIQTLSLGEPGGEGIIASDPGTILGDTGDGDGEFLFPNAAMSDSKGRIYIADGNNSRISVWNQQGEFLYAFGNGTGEGALSLPRGIFIDQHDRLFVVDAVGQDIKVYDISQDSPEFLYSFGDFGLEDGLFNFPNDIAVDSSGRVYVADRENNRIQVWSY